jgi:Motility quorum-sensing regulator, toxin of MqsA
MTKRRNLPVFSLELVQTLVGHGDYRITESALDGAAELYLDEDDIVACVQELSRSSFYKTMPSTRVPGTDQDVYRTRYAGFAIYLKIRVIGGKKVVIISFKQDTSV